MKLKTVIMSAVMAMVSVSTIAQTEPSGWQKGKSHETLMNEKNAVLGKIKEALNENGFSNIESVNILSYVKKTGMIEFEVMAKASENSIHQIEIPKGVALQKVLLNGKENFLSTYQKDVFLTVLKAGDNKLLFTGVFNDKSLFLPESFGDVRSDAKSLALNKVPGGTMVEYVGNDIREESKENAGKQEEKAILINDKPAIFVNRELVLGKEWTLNTNVSRLNNNPRAIKNDVEFELPLLNGESLIQEKLFPINNGVATLDLSTPTSWSSKMQELSNVSFKPIADNVYQVITIKEVGNWTFKADGSAANPNRVKSQVSESKKTFFLMPNDTLSLTLENPVLKEGSSNIINAIHVNSVLEKNTVSRQWNLRVDSTIGGELIINRDTDTSKIKSMFVNDKKIYFKDSDKEIKIVLQIGKNNVVIDTLKDGVSTVEKTPVWKFNMPAFNYEASMPTPDVHNRWVIFLTGNDIYSPNVLTLGYLATILIIVYLLKKWKMGMAPIQYALLFIGFLISSWFLLLIFVVSYIMFALKSSKKEYDMTYNISLAVMVLLLFWTIVVAFNAGPVLYTSGISAYNLTWIADTYKNTYATMISVPSYVYNGFILIWSLVVASFLVNVVKNYKKS